MTVYYICRKGKPYAAKVSGPYHTREQADLERLWIFGADDNYFVAWTIA